MKLFVASIYLLGALGILAVNYVFALRWRRAYGSLAGAGLPLLINGALVIVLLVAAWGVSR